jgi:hypothetical protein
MEHHPDYCRTLMDIITLVIMSEARMIKQFERNYEQSVNPLHTWIYLFSSHFSSGTRYFNLHIQVTLLFLYNTFYFPCFYNTSNSFILNLLLHWKWTEFVQDYVQWQVLVFTVLNPFILLPVKVLFRET